MYLSGPTKILLSNAGTNHSFESKKNRVQLLSYTINHILKLSPENGLNFQRPEVVWNILFVIKLIKLNQIAEWSMSD